MRKFALGFIACFFLMACAGFQYKYYGIHPSEGKLLGSKPEEDLPLSVCEPDERVKGKCVVLFTEEFKSLVLEYTDIKERLKACERR